MNKTVLMCILIITLTFCRCSLSINSPEEAARQYVGYLQTGDYEKLADAIYNPDDTNSQEVELNKLMFISILKESGSKLMELKGGIKEISILCETIFKDGNTARVNLEQTFGNGEIEKADYELIKQGKTWKLLMKK